MIDYQQPPSAILGSMAASINTRAFKCFVSTARKSLFSNRFSVVVFEGEAVLGATRDGANVMYAQNLSHEKITQIHRRIVENLDQLGDAGIPFGQAANAVLSELLAEELIEPPE